MPRVVDSLFDRHGLRDVQPPSYCPLCGRALVEWSWKTSDGEAEYPSLVCYDGAGRFREWLYRLLSVMGFTPRGVHYQYELGRRKLGGDIARPFDEYTGKPL